MQCLWGGSGAKSWLCGALRLATFAGVCLVDWFALVVRDGVAFDAWILSFDFGHIRASPCFLQLCLSPCFWMGGAHLENTSSDP